MLPKGETGKVDETDGRGHKMQMLPGDTKARGRRYRFPTTTLFVGHLLKVSCLS